MPFLLTSTCNKNEVGSVRTWSVLTDCKQGNTGEWLSSHSANERDKRLRVHTVYHKKSMNENTGHASIQQCALY